jgi:hypothetical protein
MKKRDEVSLCDWVQLEVTPAAAALNGEWQFMFG